MGKCEKMQLEIEIQWDKIEDLKKDIRSIENVESVDVQEVASVKVNILDRKPKNQFDIVSLILTVVISEASKEAIKYSKEKVVAYLKGKNAKIKNKESKPGIRPKK